jgi:hypothetical protein
MLEPQSVMSARRNSVTKPDTLVLEVELKSMLTHLTTVERVRDVLEKTEGLSEVAVDMTWYTKAEVDEDVTASS